MLNHLQFRQFGLNDKEANIYLACLRLGPSSVQVIAEAAGIHRVSAYDILEKLMEKGFAVEVRKNGKRLIKASDPEIIRETIRTRERIFTGLIPELKAIQDKDDGPKVSYHHGAEDIWRARLDCLRVQPPRSEIFIYRPTDAPAGTFPHEENEERAMLEKKSISLKFIDGGTELDSLSAAAAREPRLEKKYLLPGSELKKNIIIYRERVLLISWNRSSALIITDGDYAAHERFIFMTLWQTLPD